MFKTLVLALIMLSSVKAFHAPLRRVAKNGVRSAQMVLIPFDRPTATAPLANMMDLIENMGGLEGFLPAVTRTKRTPNMQMDVKSESEFSLVIDLPGIAKDDICITMNRGELTVSADRQSEKKDEGENFRLIERYSGHVSRTLTLPDNADVDKIEAKSVDGVLKITIPKTETEQTAIKKIEIL
ncbi:HSP20-like chaperone [Ochromonadaceae sp. CCMP2298]|nr:HSP20-like chaperone [Ochromonadaceae sp. CCMP2298]